MYWYIYAILFSIVSDSMGASFQTKRGFVLSIVFMDDESAGYLASNAVFATRYGTKHHNVQLQALGT